LIDQSKVRLERLGYFKEVTVETPKVPGSDDLIDVNYSVEEQASGSITASVGFAQNAGLILGGSISQNNFLGTGNKVNFGVTRSEFQSALNFGFVDPYWTVDGVSLGYNAFFRKTDFEELNTDVSSYAIDSKGVGATIGYPLTETSRLTYGMTVQQDDLTTGSFTVKQIQDFIDEEGENFTNFKASVGWSESTLNKGVLATRGGSQSLVLQATVPGSDLSFFKLDYRGQIFKPLTQTTTLRFHTQMGYGDGYGSSNGLPFYENYYAGGFGSVRGFRDSSLGPRSTPSRADYTKPASDPANVNTCAPSGKPCTDPDQDPLPFGGNVLIQGGTELLFPLPFIKDQSSLRTSLFLDVGNVFQTNCDGYENGECQSPGLGELAISTGVGLTWITGFGPLSFSLAAPLKKPDNADTQIFQFSLGQTF
jgi:outer membrane protein insertion porin family